MKKILIVEDDNNILELEKDYLEANNFQVLTAKDGETGLKMALSLDIDLVLLDVMLPELDGFKVCKKLREEKDIPILLVTAKKEGIDKLQGFGLGADDYIVKPFSPSELVARVMAHIAGYDRLTNKVDTSVIEIGDLKIDKNSRRAYIKDEEIVFTNKEFDLLAFLAEHPNTVINKDEIFKKIWNYDSIGETSTITVHINRIRDKIKAVDANNDYVETIWGSGYRFKI